MLHTILTRGESCKRAPVFSGVSKILPSAIVGEEVSSDGEKSQEWVITRKIDRKIDTI